MARPDTGTRQKLIDTASDLLWTSSYGSVSVDDICKAAGVKKGSFYHYFPSKQALAITALEEYYDQNIKPDMDRIFAANRPFKNRLQDLAKAVIAEQQKNLEHYGRVCGCPLAAMASENIAPDQQEIGDTVCKMFDHCKNYLHSALADAMDSGLIPRADILEKADAIHDYITGLMMMARIHNSLDGLERDLETGIFRIVGLAPDITLKDTLRRT
jgi:TetR/AcrR family transcriptional repressor of nem operon